MKLALVDIGKELKLDSAGRSNISTVYDPTQGLFPVFWTIIKNVYVLTGIILFIMIVVGGIGMIANAGNAEKQKQSSQTLSSAVIGYLIMFVAYWIVKIIEVITGKTIFL
jgi:uncharacterized membrane protein